MQNLFFDSWESVVRIAVTTILGYVLLIFVLRISGKRTLSKMNAFDFIVTIALGSSLATVMLNKSVPLLDGVLALFLLVFLQFIITWLSSRSQAFSNLIKATPTLLLYKGNMLKDVMKKERITEDEIHAIIREKGMSSYKEADAVVLETDGSLTVIQKVENWSSATIEAVQKPELHT